jgi:hypothetical protein
VLRGFLSGCCRCRLTEQIDHHSLFVFMWVFGWPLSAFYDMVSR